MQQPVIVDLSQTGSYIHSYSRLIYRTSWLRGAETTSLLCSLELDFWLDLLLLRPNFYVDILRIRLTRGRAMGAWHDNTFDLPTLLAFFELPPKHACLSFWVLSAAPNQLLAPLQQQSASLGCKYSARRLSGSLIGATRLVAAQPLYKVRASGWSIYLI